VCVSSMTARTLSCGQIPSDPSGAAARICQDIESAVYFCELEALNNVAKYAEATRAEVSLAQDDGHLRFAVVDVELRHGGDELRDRRAGDGRPLGRDRRRPPGGLPQGRRHDHRRPDPDAHELRYLTDPARSSGEARPSAVFHSAGFWRLEETQEPTSEDRG
jgi:hypothetical protein